MVAGFPELPFILVSIIIRAGIGESNPGTCTGVQVVLEPARGCNHWARGVRLRFALGGLFLCRRLGKKSWSVET